MVEEEHSRLSAAAPASLSLSSASASHLAARFSRSDRRDRRETSKHSDGFIWRKGDCKLKEFHL